MRSPKIAILTRGAFRSPRFLTEGLQRMLARLGVPSDVHLDGVSWLRHAAAEPTGPRDRVRAAMARRSLRRLTDYDLFIVTETLEAFREHVDLAVLRSLGKPVLLYQVFYLGGSKYWLDRLPADALDKFDGYLAVSGIHGTPPRGQRPLHVIGMDVMPRQPFMPRRDGFSALVDFPREGYEEQRTVQLNALRRVGIRPVCLEGEYTFDTIEKVYREVAFAFVSFPEAYGVPIAQLQQYGAQILSPNKSWVMRHALLPHGAVFSSHDDPPFSENFGFYRDEDDLCGQLTARMETYDPRDVLGQFLERQRAYAVGDPQALWDAVRTYV